MRTEILRLTWGVGWFGQCPEHEPPELPSGQPSGDDADARPASLDVPPETEAPALPASGCAAAGEIAAAAEAPSQAEERKTEAAAEAPSQAEERELDPPAPAAPAAESAEHGKLMLDYTARPKSISDIRRFLKKKGAQTLAEERVRALQHPMFKKYSSAMLRGESMASWGVIDGESDTKALQDLRGFIVWLHDKSGLSSDELHETREPAQETEADITLESLAAKTATQAVLDAQFVEVDPMYEHLPNPSSDAMDLLNAGHGAKPTAAAAKAKHAIKPSKAKQSHIEQYAAKSKDRSSEVILNLGYCSFKCVFFNHCLLFRARGGEVPKMYVLRSYAILMAREYLTNHLCTQEQEQVALPSTPQVAIRRRQTTKSPAPCAE